MSENEFEKKVQSEMTGLKIKPSEEVWPKVEERIRKKDRRRLFIIIFLLIGLALLGYWQFYFPGEKKNSIVKAEPTKEKEAKPNKITESEKLTTPSQGDIKKAEKDIPAETISKTEPQRINNKKQKTIIVKNANQQESRSEIKINSVNKRVKEHKQSISAKIPEQPINKNPVANNLVKQEPAKKGEAVGDKKILNNEIKTDKESKEPIKPEEKIINQNDSVSLAAKETEPEKKIDKKEEGITENEKPKDTASVVAPKKPSSKKWKWGIVFAPGISSLSNKAFSIDGLTSVNARLDALSAGAGGFPAQPTPPAPPSANRADFAFQLGSFAKKQISKRSSLLIGLQYAYYSDRINIGGNRDSILNYSTQLTDLQKASAVYGAAGKNNRYINHYHFIESPIVYETQLNKNSSRHFYLRLGATVGQMISTNALVYDTAFGGIYYNNKNRFNKTQFSLSASFAWSFYNKQHSQWIIGPDIGLHLNRLLNNPLDRNKYLLFTGIKAAIVFPRKK